MQLWLTLSKVVVIIRTAYLIQFGPICMYKRVFLRELRFSPSNFNFLFGQRSVFDGVFGNLNLSMNYINRPKKPKTKKSDHVWEPYCSLG